MNPYSPSFQVVQSSWSNVSNFRSTAEKPRRDADESFAMEIRSGEGSYRFANATKSSVTVNKCAFSSLLFWERPGYTSKPSCSLDNGKKRKTLIALANSKTDGER